MNRRSFLVCSAASAMSCALPLGLTVGQAVGAVATQDASALLSSQQPIGDALFRLHNWETDLEHTALDETSAPFISLSANWKASWL
ncbi:MAG: hypothetical protein WCG12_11805 [Alcaligenaceae bacterium]